MKESVIDKSRLMTVTTPGLPLFAGEYGNWGTVLRLPRMHELTRGLPSKARPDGNALSSALQGSLEEGEVIVYVQPPDKWPVELQFLSLRVLEHGDAELAGQVLEALFAWYPSLSSTYDFVLDDPTQAHLLPPVSDAEALMSLIRLEYIVVQQVPSLVPYLGLAFSCSWDAEHGLGVLAHGTDILEIGTQDVVWSWDHAEQHQAALVERLKSGNT